MTRIVGFKLTCDIVAIICLFFSILYYFCADGQQALNRSKWVEVSEEDEYLYLNKQIVPMGGVITPISGASSFKNRSISKRPFKYTVQNEQVITRTRYRIEQDENDYDKSNS
jgi:hypothetical protein